MAKNEKTEKKSIADRVRDMAGRAKQSVQETIESRAEERRELRAHKQGYREVEKQGQKATTRNKIAWDSFVRRYNLRADREHPGRYWIDDRSYIDVNLASADSVSAAMKIVTERMASPKVQTVKDPAPAPSRKKSGATKKDAAPRRGSSPPAPAPVRDVRYERSPFYTDAPRQPARESRPARQSPPPLGGFMDGPGLLDSPRKKRR